MKTTARLMWVLGGVFLAIDGVYLFWSLIADNFEIVGLMTMGLSGVLCLFFAFYFGRLVAAGGPSPLVEDRIDATVDDGDPEMGFFSPWSWWPVLLAGSLAILFLGVALSAWIAFIALPLLVICLVGWVFEYYRGHFAR